MVFISSYISIEELQERKISEETVESLDWFLFSREISSKNLRYSGCSGGCQPYLRDYITRIYWYPMFYDKPLYCYLMSDSYFFKLHLLRDRFIYSAAIWNMKRVPSTSQYDEKYRELYPVIPEEKWIFDGNYDNEYLERKFKELVDCNLNKCGINCVVLDGR